MTNEALSQADDTAQSNTADKLIYKLQVHQILMHKLVTRDSMPIVKAKPTSPGRRFVEKVVHPHLYKGRPYAPLVEAKGKSGGRNNNGRITTRHIGGGHKQHYRVIDFKRTKDGIPATVERIEYDPNRTAHIALLKYADGERRYIIAPRRLQVGDSVQSGEGSPIRPGNCLPLKNIPVGTVISNVELKIGKGAVRTSAGASVNCWVVMAPMLFYVFVQVGVFISIAMR